MSKIVIRGGHNFRCTGASALIDETIEDRKVKDSIIKYLKLAGETVIDATPGNCTENDDLNYGTNMSDKNNADYFIPIHFNKAYTSYKGAIGSEVWLNPDNKNSVAVGTRVLSKLYSLGFKNRGCKDGVNGEHLHDVKVPKASSILIEVCFCEATEDVALYKKLGVDAIGKAIAEGIVGHSINIVVPVVAPVIKPVEVPIVPEKLYKIQAGAYKSKVEADKAIAELKAKGIDSFSKLV